ncbi:superoxide dismutase family protein [uncultured Luteimonas sp.]|uniref:superoxide dismutase family protein n=1 Tax=uncultured Luteimonas sp. TaxID=453144 RepID=UPI002609F3B0|nr:superoxide dismutase family protein [uncultured Luteimonas sp.]
MRHARLLLLPAALLLAACQPQAPAEPDPVDAPAAPAEAPASVEDAAATGNADMMREAVSARASATLQATEGNSVAGTLEFTSVDGGVRVTGQVTGLQGGEHGFHVHENGDCSAPDASSAGGHFNPASTAHGRVGQGEHHAGDSDNISANAQGVATVDTLLQGVTLGDGSGTDIVGKGVIVHADPDDYTTQPTGNAGGRLACGVIAAQ